MRIRAKEIRRARKRDEERLHEKIKALRKVKPTVTSTARPTGSRPPGSRPAGGGKSGGNRPAGQRPQGAQGNKSGGAPRPPRPKPTPQPDSAPAPAKQD